MTVRQIATLWSAIRRRHEAEVDAQHPASGPTGRVSRRAAGGQRPPVEQYQTPDGRVSKQYNLWSFALSQPKGDKPLR